MITDKKYSTTKMTIPRRMNGRYFMKTPPMFLYIHYNGKIRK